MVAKKYKIVFIPCDTHEALEEWEIKCSEDKLVESLTDRLKVHFKGASGQKTAEQEARQHAELMKSLPEGTKVDAAMLRVATDMQMVENIALLSNDPQYGFVGVNMYADDQGAIKQLPRNIRASDIANVAGKSIEVRGDAFLGRVLDDGEAFDRLDLSVSEVSSGAQWVKDAAAQNRRKANDSRPAEMAARMQASVAAADRTRSGAKDFKDSKASQATASVEAIDPAEEAKAAGNKAFAEGEYEKAVKHYDAALRIDGSLVPALNNRAMAHLKMGNNSSAQDDATSVLELQPGNVKAMLRRAAAREAMGNSDGARQDYNSALAAEPQNAAAAEGVKNLTHPTK